MEQKIYVKKKIFIVSVVLLLVFFSLITIPTYSFADISSDYIPSPYVESQEDRSYEDSLKSSEEQTTDENLRNEEGIVSQLATNKHNPYNGQIRLHIDIGSEFATFNGSECTEGYIIKVSPGGEINLPKIQPKQGYYFVGWCQGGIPQEPTWDLFTKTLTMTDDLSQGKDMTVYAIYANDSGDGYCTCGAWEKEIYQDKIEQIKMNSNDYIKTFSPNTIDNNNYSSTNIVMLVIVTLMLLILIIIPRYYTHHIGHKKS